MSNTIHIVFGAFAKQNLQKSNGLSIPAENIIDLNDDFRVGPIQNLNTRAGIENRKTWFSSNIETDDLTDIQSQDREKIEFLKRLSFHKVLYIWSGSDAFEILSVAKLLYELKEFSKNIFIADFSNVKLERKDGTFYVPESIVIVLPEHLKIIVDYFQPLSEEKKQELIQLWKRVESENAVIRILNKHGDIKSVKESYFDLELLKHCKEAFQKAARVIGGTLVAIEFNAHDSTLNWRLKHLVKLQMLEFKGELNEIRDYQVKLRKYH